MKSGSLEKIIYWLESEQDDIQSADLQAGIYIYGAGALGQLALEYCEARCIHVHGFVDRSEVAPVVSKTANSYQVFSPSAGCDVVDKKRLIVVAIAILPYAPIKEQLSEQGWESVFPFYSVTSEPNSSHPLQNGWRLGYVTDQEKCIVTELCRHWTDPMSWAHYEAFIAWHRNCTELVFENALFDPGQRYLIPEVLSAVRSRQRQLIDVGSHRGESISRFTTANLIFDKYVLFEPDLDARLFLQENVDKLISSEARVTVMPDVLSDRKDTTRYQAGLGYCSQIWEFGSETRLTNTLDDCNLKPDFIKVHTEGSEAKILEGAKRTIGACRPLVVFSVYHRREGFYSDIRDVMAICPEYRWYFRLHGYQGTSAFVYGIPRSVGREGSNDE